MCVQIFVTYVYLTSFRSSYIGARISLDYRWSLKGIDIESDDWNEKAEPVHQRAADLILWGCLKNGGLYIKLGQGLVTMNHLLPRPYLKTLEVLQDRALAKRENEVHRETIMS